MPLTTQEWRRLALDCPTDYQLDNTTPFDYRTEGEGMFNILTQQMNYPRFMALWLCREYGLLNPNPFRLSPAQPLPSGCNSPREVVRAFLSASHRTDQVKSYIARLFKERCGVKYYDTMEFNSSDIRQTRCPVSGTAIPDNPLLHQFYRTPATGGWWILTGIVILENGEVYNRARHGNLIEADRDYSDAAGLTSVTRTFAASSGYSTRVSGIYYPRWVVEADPEAVHNCAHCGCFIWEEDSFYNEDEEYYECAACRTEDSESESESDFIRTIRDSARFATEMRDLAPLMDGVERYGIYSYNDAAAGSLPSTSIDDLMGYELEWAVPVTLVKPDGNLRRCGPNHSYEFLRCMATHVMNKVPHNYAIIKHDGSIKAPVLSDDVCGFEFVSRPEDLATHTKLLTQFWGRLPKQHLAHSFMNCPLGMHIHLDRRRRNAFREGKLIMFLYNPLNRVWLLDLAQRSELRRYAAFPAASEYNWWLARGAWANPLSAAANAPSKYVAVRLCRRTIELRFFRSQTELTGVLRNLEFADAVKQFVASVSVRDLTYVAFAQWVSDHRKTHPNFHRWFETTGVNYLPRTKKTKRTK